MSLSGKQRQHLRALAHKLKPVILVGANGLSEAVLAEVEIALEHHELIKVKLPAGEREARQSMIDTIVSECRAEPVQSIGRIAVFYRRAEKPRIELPR